MAQGVQKHIADLLLGNKKRVQSASMFICLAVFVSLGVVALFRQNGIAANATQQVLDCPVHGVVAHTHDESCYDAEGALVCPLPEIELHVHDESCYTEETVLVCDIEEGEGAHTHDESCYDGEGNLVCELEESEGHVHSDACYEVVRTLTCDKEEVTEEHVHGPACFREVEVDDGEPDMPEQSFSQQFKDANDAVVLTVTVKAPEGALPAGSSMKVEWVDAAEIDNELVQSALDAKAAEEGAPAGKIDQLQAVSIAFQDETGAQVEPAANVTVTLTSALVSPKDTPVLVGIESEVQAKARAEQEGTSEYEIAATPLDPLDDQQLGEHEIVLSANQLAYDLGSTYATYVLATTTQAIELQAESETERVIVQAPAEAGIAQGSSILVNEISEGTQEYEAYEANALAAMSADRAELARFFDITIVGPDGKEVQPQAPVNVKIKLVDAPLDGTHPAVVHFEGEASNAAAEVIPSTVVKRTTTFEAESFSVYGVLYTVDFAYEDYTYSLAGGSSMKLSALFAALGIEDKVADVTAVAFSNPDLLTVAGPKDDGDWSLTSLAPFESEESLTVTLPGKLITIKVTDAQGDAGALGAAGDGGPITLTVQKVWEEDGTTEVPERVDVTLSRTRTPLANKENTLIIKANNGSQRDIGSYQFEHGTTATITYNYTDSGYVQYGDPGYSIDGNDMVSVQGEASGSFDIEIPLSGATTVVFNDGWGGGRLGEITATGTEITDGDPEPDTAFNEAHHALTLTADGDWSASSAELPSTEELDGTTYAYTYSVAETPVDGWAASYSENNAAGLSESGTITVTNVPATTVTAQKAWVDDSGAATDWPEGVTSVEVKVQRRSGSGAYRDVPDVATQHIYASEGDGQTTATFTGLPKTTPDGVAYEYRVVETDPGKDYIQTLSGRHNHFTLTNRPVERTDVQFEKTWDENVTADMGWEASFVLQELLYPYDANYNPETAHDSADTLADTWSNVEPEVTWTITNDSTVANGELVQRNLPKYREVDGKIYIIMYSVEETGYKIWDNAERSGEPTYSWSGGSSFTGDMHFTPEYLEDADEVTDYKIEVLNSKRNEKENTFIDFDLKKTWHSGDDTEDPATANDSYATFQLKRKSHQEFKSLVDPEVDYSKFVTVRIVDAAGREISSLEVEKNAQIKLQAGFKAGADGVGTVIFTNTDGTTGHVEISNTTSNANQILVSSQPFRVNADATFQYSSGENYLADGIYGVVISDRCDGTPTADVDDAEFNARTDTTYRIDKNTGHVISYSGGTLTDTVTSDGWTIAFNDLPQTIVDTGVQRETTTVYGYYFEEVASNPSYTATYYQANADGAASKVLNGDEDNRIYFDDHVIAANEAHHLTIKKYWESLVQSEMPNLVVDIKRVESDGNNVNVNAGSPSYKKVILTADNDFEYNLYELQTQRQGGGYWAYVPIELGITMSKPGDDGVAADGTIEDESKVSYVALDSTAFESPKYAAAKEGDTINYMRLKADDIYRDQFTNLDAKGEIIRNGSGTICIVNRPNKTGYQLAIRKRWHKFTEGGGMTTEAAYDGAYFTAMLVQIVKDAETGEEVKRIDYGDTFDWKFDGNTDFKYRDQGRESNITIRYHNGQWLVVIPEGSGSDGSNLPSHGYYTDANGNTRVAVYDYTVREIAVTSLDGYHWAISDHIDASSAQDISGSGVNGGHIWMLDNFPDADLKIVKHWPRKSTNADTTAVYFKITDSTGKNVIQEIAEKQSYREHQLTAGDVAQYNGEWCLVVRGASGSTDDWIGYIDHMPLFDFSSTKFGDDGIVGDMPGELSYNIEEVAVNVGGTLTPSSEVYLPYYQVTTRGTKGSVRMSAEGVQLGMQTADEALQPTIVEVTNNAVEDLEVEKKFFLPNGTQVDPAEMTDWNVGGTAVNKVEYVVKVVATTTDPEGNETTRSGYLPANYKQSPEGNRSIAESIDGAEVFSIEPSDWTSKPDQLQGLPSVDVVQASGQENPTITTYAYSIAEKAVYAGSTDVSEYFTASPEYDEDAEVWYISNTRTEPTQLDITKEWSEGSIPEDASWEVTFKVQYSRDGSTWHNYTIDGEVPTYTLTSEDADGITVKGLPKYVDETADPLVEYQYRAVETAYQVTIEGKTYAFETETFSEASGQSATAQVLRNTLTDLPITKQWMQGESLVDWPADVSSITYQVHRVLTYDTFDTEGETEDEVLGTVVVARTQVAGSSEVAYTASLRRTGSEDVDMLEVDTTGSTYKVQVPYLPTTGVKAIGERVYPGTYTYYVVEVVPEEASFAASYDPEYTGEGEAAQNRSAEVEGGTQVTVNNTLENVPVPLDILKVDKNDETKHLEGATFTIVKVQEQITGNEPSVDTSWTYAGGAQTTASDGTAGFVDLGAGYYKITETATPAGYVLTGSDHFYIKVEGGAAKLVQVKIEGDAKSWEEVESVENVTFEAATTDASATATVSNEPGRELPAAGGSGTALLYVLGFTLLAGASALLLRERIA